MPPLRDNPYDINPHGIVSGYVRAYVGTGLEGVTVSTIPMKYAAQTNANGYWAMDPDTGAWKFVASFPPDYAADTSDWVYLAPGDSTGVTLYLNALPYFVAAWIQTHHEERDWFPQTTYYDSIFLHVNDRDGAADIESGWVTFDTTIVPCEGSGEWWTVSHLFESNDPDILESMMDVPFQEIFCSGYIPKVLKFKFLSSFASRGLSKAT